MRFKFWLLLFVLFIGSCGQKTNSSLDFYGADNRLAHLTFSAYFDFKTAEKFDSKEEVFRFFSKRLHEIKNKQVKHIFGALTEHPDYQERPGIIYNNPSVSRLTKIKQLGPMHYRVWYEYRDKAVFHRSLFIGGRRNITFYLPRDIDEIYFKGVKEIDGKDVNLCTNEFYNGPENFWYFWNPFKKDCPLTKNDLLEINARVEPLPDTKGTKPHYGKFPRFKNKTNIHVTYLVGVDENFHMEDFGAQAFRNAKQLLGDAKFKSKKITHHHYQLTRSTGIVSMNVDLYLVSAKENRFLDLAIKGMQDSDVFIYNGHSGLGDYLSIDRLNKYSQSKWKIPFFLNQEKYQIFYFNGCSTFAYYNHSYFKLKSTKRDPEGTRNLDILTTAIGASFDVGAEHDVSLLLSLIEKRSWKTVIDRITNIYPHLSALTHVNGDR